MLIINDIKNFNLDETITCGQIFRYEFNEDGSYTVILMDRVINVKYKDDKLFIESNNYENLEDIVIKYFDLNRNYDEMNEFLIKKDASLFEIIESCKGLKMIHSYPFETIISYIISANNSVSSIKKSVDKISQLYGKKVHFKNKDYYLFPTPEELKHVSTIDYRNCSIGFRDKYVKSIVDLINDNPDYLEKLSCLDTDEAFETLLKEKGIGPKVASCILLFAYQKFDVFPVDTWVKKFMIDKYGVKGEKEIKKMTKQIYGEYSAIAIQYMFHYRRNKFTK